MIGRELSHYRLLAPLGSGGMGEVWRAEDTLLGRPVALKFPHRHLLTDADARNRFLREARAASALDHPNIVVLYEVATAGDDVFLAMQLVEGSTLRARMGTRTSVTEAVRITMGIADALAHAHSRGIVHRDVKPENVLVTGDGRVKVADFGTARALDETLTQGRTLVGTPAYLAPEVVAGRPADARADLYALGVLLHELLAGEPPFDGDTAAALLYQVAHEPPAPLPSSVPAELRRVVERLLVKDPAQRFATAVEVSDALQRFSDGTSSQLTGVTRSAPLPMRSIAVLDFKSLTGDPQDQYFCAGITEDLLTELLKIPDLKVASRHAVESLRNRTSDIREAGEALGVATILEGGVRRAGSRVRVTAQLVRTDNGYQMWADRYDRDVADVFEVQDDIARRVANALRVALEPDDEEARLGRRTKNARAYDLRLRALDLYRRFEQGAMREAIGLLEQAVAEDPDYALALAELAESQVQMFCKGWDTRPEVLDAAERRVQRALELAPSLPEGYGARAHLLNHRRRMTEALRDAHRALELDPRYVPVMVILANNYTYLGDPARSEVYARRAIEMDPTHPSAHVNLASALYRQGRPAEAESNARHALKLSRTPRFRGMAYEMLALIHQSNPAGLESLLEELDREQGSVETMVQRALVLALLGRKEESRTAIEAALAVGAPSNDETFSAARVWMVLGERERALDALERSSAEDVIDLDEVRTDPWLKTLAGEPRFERLFTLQS